MAEKGLQDGWADEAPKVSAEGVHIGSDKKGCSRVLAARVSRERSPHRDTGTGSSDASILASGTQVVLRALQSRPELCGVRATVLDFDAPAGRYGVCVDSSIKKLRIKSDNLQVSIFA